MARSEVTHSKIRSRAPRHLVAVPFGYRILSAKRAGTADHQRSALRASLACSRRAACDSSDHPGDTTGKLAYCANNDEQTSGGLVEATEEDEPYYPQHTSK
jgi:hypothetical protein